MKDLNLGNHCSIFYRYPATSAELGSSRISAFAAATEYFDGLGCAPIERRGADRNSATAAELGTSRVFSAATSAGDCQWLQRCGLDFVGDWFKSRVATAPAVLHSFGKTRVTLGAHHNH